MTPEEQAVIDAVKAWRVGITTGLHIRIAVDALLASEQPPAPVWPDLPTDDVGWQSTIGEIYRGNKPFLTGPWRELEVTYKVKGEPAPVTHERWGLLYPHGDVSSYSEHICRESAARGDGYKLVRIVATEVPDGS